MKLLALDTSTEYLSLALLKGEQVYAYDALAGQSHSQVILPELQKLLAQADLALPALQGIAFGAGPGSFTGVRIAAGVTQGLAFGNALPVVPVCTLLAVAQASGAQKVIACLDARMGEVYHAVYEQVDGAWLTVVEPGLYKPDAVPAISGSGWIGAGSGWQTYPDQLGAAYSGQIVVTQPEVLPTATAILQLAKPVFVRGEGKPAHEAMPIYIRNRVALKTAERAQGLKL